MNTTQNKANAEQGINISDLFYYLLSKWKWFLLSVIIFGTLGWYRYATSPEIYFSTATVVIKDPSNKTVTAGLDRFDSYINKVNVANEILQFRSIEMMEDVVERLNLNIDYTIKDGLRTTNLYTTSPVQLSLKDVLPERYFSFKVTPLDSIHVLVSDIEGIPGAESTYKIRLGKAFMLNEELLTITATSHYGAKWKDKVIQVTKMPESSTVDYFQSNLSIRQEEDESSILNISIRDTSPLRATDVINTLVAVYNEEAIRDKNQVAINTADFINDRLIIIENELGDVESDLEKYKKNNQIVDLDITANRYEGEAVRYAHEAIDRETQLKWAVYIREYLNDPSKSRELLPTNTGLEGSKIDDYIAKYNSLRLKRDRMADDSGESNPVLEEIDQTLHGLRQTVVRSVDNLIVNLNVQREDALNREARSQARTASIPSKERALLSIERQQKIKESLYIFLLNKREENALSQAMADNNARMVDHAHGPKTPIAPNRNRMILLGIAIGLVLPCIFFLLKLFLDTKVHSRKDIEGKISVPLLGEIPYDKLQSKRQQLDSEEEEVTDDVISEAFRIIRTNIAFMAKTGQEQQVITFTSFNEGAGKTFISRNLALSLALTGKKVVVVDLDIRKATLSRYFKAHKTGVTNYIIDNDMKAADIVQHRKGYDFISAGSTAPNPAELLMSERLDELIKELRNEYDYIIADNVPVGIIADATIANRIADLTIFVARIGRLDRRQLPDIERLYTENKLNNMALLLNGAEISHRYGYYGYYGYGYGNYGYGYSYGKNKQKKHKSKHTKNK